MADEKVKAIEELADEMLNDVSGGTNFPDDWSSVPLAEKRARLVMSARLRQLGRPCEFD